MGNRRNEMKSCKEFLTERKLMLSIVAIMLGILVLAPLAAAPTSPTVSVNPTNDPILNCDGSKDTEVLPTVYVYPINAPILQTYGMTYGQWSEKWWQWALSIPADRNPLADTTGEFAAEGQSDDSHVWFIGGVIGQAGDMKPSATRTCTIPQKALFFPIINCESSDREYGFTTEADMRADATASINGITDLKVVVDGKELEGLWGQRVQSESGIFNFTLPADNVLGIDIAGGDGTTNAVSDGYWIMLAPLSVGAHTIQIYGKWRGGTPEDPLAFETDVTYKLKVL